MRAILKITAKKEITYNFPDSVFWTSFVIYLVALLLFTSLVWAQVPSQTLKGRIVDQQSSAAIPGAHVVVLDSNPLIGDVTDADGNFKIPNLPVGRYNLKVMSMGYEIKTIPDVLVGAGKEVVLTIDLLESMIELEELVINANMNKEQPFNGYYTGNKLPVGVLEKKFALFCNREAIGCIKP